MNAGHPPSGVPLETVVRTADLAGRPTRAPDYQRQSAALQKLSRALADSPQQILETLCTVAQEVCEAGSAGVSLLSPEHGETRFFWPAITGHWRGHVGGGTPRDFGPCGVVLARDSTQLFISPERYYPYIRGVEPAIHEALLAPFYVADKAVGTVWVLSHDPARQFDAEDQRQLESLAEFASGAHQVVESIKVLEANRLELQRSQSRLLGQMQDMEHLQGLIARLGVTPDLNAALEEILAASMEIGHAAKGNLQLFDAGRGVLKIACQRGFDRPFLQHFDVIEVASGAAGARALRTRRRVLIPDVLADEDYAPHAAVATAAGYRAVQSTPLIGSEGQVLGVLSTHYGEVRQWSANELAFLDLYAHEAALVLERHQNRAELQEALWRLQATLKTNEVATWVWDSTADRVFADSNLARMFCVAPEHAAGGPLSEYLKAIHPEDRQQVEASIAATVAGTSEEYQAEFRLMTPDGSIRWVAGRGRLERGATGAPARFPGVVIDITERKLAEQKLLDADRRKNEFLATLAHELRNPLAPIRNGVRLLGQDIEPAKLPSVVAMMNRQVEQMVHLIDDLLDVSRVSQGKVELRRERIELSAVLRQVLETSQPLCDRFGHQVTLTLPGRPAHVLADATRLNQIFTNLLNNACKFTDRNGRITIVVELHGAQAQVRMRDSGIGLAADQLPRIFDLFSQADTSLERPESGLGIGLTLVKRLVELHGGTVKADSAGLGHGSEFTVQLPLATGQAALPVAAEIELPSRPRSVLIVDDNRDAAESLGMLLALDGHETRVAFSGEEALATLQAGFEPEFVLMDIGLPGMNGYEVARQMRANHPHLACRLVALTGWGQPEDRTRSREAEFSAHMVKPVDFDALMKLLSG